MGRIKVSGLPKKESSELPHPSEGRTVPATRGDENVVQALPRSTVRLDPDTFLAIFTLTESQPWLKEKQVELCELIQDCNDHSEQLLLFKLLKRFTFLDGTTFQEAVQSMASYIENQLGFGDADCSIVASDNGRFSDSSQLILYHLKASKWKSLDWNTTSFIANLGSLADGVSKKNLVVVDEFIGTGETAEKKVRWIKDKLKAQGQEPKIFFAAIAGMEIGIARLSAHVDGVFAAHKLRRGISDLSLPTDMQVDLELMRKLEESLSAEGRRGKLKKHSLGYKASESLYARVNGNTPNNVFPIFWWEKKMNGGPRQPLLSCL